jgi:hypothetical protein
MELPQALELPAGCIAAGLPVRTACAAVVQSFDGPVADDLGQVLSLMDLGVGDAEPGGLSMIIRSWDLWLQTCLARWSREPRWWRGLQHHAAKRPQS